MPPRWGIVLVHYPTSAWPACSGSDVRASTTDGVSMRLSIITKNTANSAITVGTMRTTKTADTIPLPLGVDRPPPRRHLNWSHYPPVESTPQPSRHDIAMPAITYVTWENFPSSPEAALRSEHSRRWSPASPCLSTAMHDAIHVFIHVFIHGLPDVPPDPLEGN